MSRHSDALCYALRQIKCDRFKKYVKAIYLYGSCARGDERYNSDVDLFLVLEEDTPVKVVRELKTVVTSKDYTLPCVEIKTGTVGKISGSEQFDINLRKDRILLWEKN